MESKNKKLRSGYTTGACAAAAAKAAALLVLKRHHETLKEVEIPFPSGTRATFTVRDSDFSEHESSAWASVIKDAGDDPDVTHGAEITATVQRSSDKDNRGQAPCGVQSAEYPEITIRGGKGVGTVTKPGLAIPVGEPAINPVPRMMIVDAVQEAVIECGVKNPGLEVTISVPAGEELAKKTLNHRLGIIGGISILGTTGIVKPLSEAAWTATITSSFDVAKALGREEVVLSTGRTSERAHQKKYGLPEDCYVMMGDYTEFSLHDAKEHRFRKIHLCAQWAKMIKIAMSTPQTHVRHGALEAKAAARFLAQLGIDIIQDRAFNTSREIYDYIYSELRNPQPAMKTVCTAAKQYAETVTGGIPVVAYLVSYEGEIVAESE